jgi:hypothetical protein
MVRDVPLVPVVLDVSLEENIRRLQSPGRVGRKLTEVASLKRMVSGYTLQRPAVPELIVVEVTACSPEQAAETIGVRLRQLMPGLRPATHGHLRMAAP